MQINLNSVAKVNDFVNAISKIDGNIGLISGRCSVNAKSILGIFSLDLSKPIRVEFNGSKNRNYIEKALSKFAVNQA
jgi:phosphotransferase system HPr-like phosphotransfer protein